MLGIVEQWGLKVGSKVAWSNDYSSKKQLGTVVKITPSGFVDVDGLGGLIKDVVRFNQKGLEVSKTNPRKLFKLTPELEAKIERDRLIAEFSEAAKKASEFPNRYTTEQIKVLLGLLCRPEKWDKPDRTAQVENAFYASADF